MQTLIDQLVHKLKQEGVIVQYYSSMTSKSVYLKLDYGVLKSIRISDHKGKPHLKYRYNLLTSITKYRYDRTHKRFYYPVNQVDAMLKQILKDRQDKISRYGQQKYNHYMMENQKDNQHKNGFWANAVVL